MINKEQHSFLKIIDSPIFGLEFYSNEMLKKLFDQLIKIKKLLDIDDKSLEDKIFTIEQYIIENVEIRLQYFNAKIAKNISYLNNELKYRTAYSALVEGSSACYGYAEAIALLFSLYNIKVVTLLSKLPGKKYDSVHYTTIVKCSETGIYYVIDPERKLYCKYKNRNFSEYLEEIIFIIPPNDWKKIKLDNFGTGMLASDLLKRDDAKFVIGYSNLSKIL